MDHILKSDFMQKRSQMKGQLFYKENYTYRWFELTSFLLRYKDGSLENGPNKLKGSVHLNNIRSVEITDPAIIGDRPNAFQITYIVADNIFGELRTLYVIAMFKEQRNEWITAIRKAASDAGGLVGHKFHPGMWSGKAFSCCGHINRRDEGCSAVTANESPGPTCQLTKGNENIAQAHNHQQPVKNIQPLPPPSLIRQVEEPEAEKSFPPKPLPRKNVTEKPPVQQTNVNKTVVALYDYSGLQENFIELLQGEEYIIVEDSNANYPMKVKNNKGIVGYVPENYVQIITGNENDLKLFEWFYPNTSKVQAESILQNDNREGSFIVRDSAKNDYLYAISVLTRKGKDIEAIENPFITKHYHIKMNSAKQFYLNEKNLFDTVPQLIYYHKRNSAGLIVRLKHHPSDKTKPPPLLDLMEISPDLLEFKGDLGVGQFGKVQMAILNKELIVAVKSVNPGMMTEFDFLDEAKNMGKLHHQNLVKLIGVCKKPLMIIVEYMKHGALTQYLKRNENYFAKEPEKLLDICIQVAKGMKYLEMKRVLHRDLAARNCLVGDGQIVKVCDFGLARYVPDDEYLSSYGTKFAFRWSSPEVMKYQVFSSKSDVWSFGILMWEVFTCAHLLPYHDIKSNPEVSIFVCDKNGVPEKPQFCSTSIYKIMKMCWEMDPESRPTFAKLVNSLNEENN